MRYISSNTHSFSVNVAPPTGTPLPTTIIGCTPAAAPTECSGTAVAPVGSDEFLIKDWSGVGGAGSVLASTSVAETITAGVQTLTLTLNPVVAAVTVSLSSPPPATGASPVPWLNKVAGLTSAAAQLTITDPSGARIIGPGSFQNSAGKPITIAFSNSDSSGATCLSTAPLNAATTACPPPPSLSAPGPGHLYVTLLTASTAPTAPPFDDPNITVAAPGVAALTGADVPVTPTTAYLYNASSLGDLSSIYGSDLAYGCFTCSQSGNPSDGILFGNGSYEIDADPPGAANSDELSARLLIGGFTGANAGEEWFVVDDVPTKLSYFRYSSAGIISAPFEGNPLSVNPSTVYVASDGNLWFSASPSKAPGSVPQIGVVTVSSPGTAPVTYGLSHLTDQANPAQTLLAGGPSGSLFVVTSRASAVWIDKVALANPSAATEVAVKAAEFIETPIDTVGYSPIDGHVYLVDGSANANIFDVDPVSGSATLLAATRAPNTDAHQQMATLRDGTLAYLAPYGPFGTTVVHIVPNRKPNPVSILVPYVPSYVSDPGPFGATWGIGTNGAINDSDGGNVRAAVW